MITKRAYSPDIVCDGCARSIQRSLSTLAGVDSVTVDVAARQVTVTYSEEQVTPDVIADRLDAAGFRVTWLDEREEVHGA